MLKLKKLCSVTLCLVCTGLVISPAFGQSTLNAGGGVNLNGEGYIYNVRDLQPGALGFTNALLTDYVINLGQLVGHYADGAMITNALDLLPYVGQSLDVTDADGNTMVSLSETGIYLYDDVLEEFVPITVTNGNLFFNGNPVGGQGTASALTLIDESAGGSEVVVTVDGGTLNVDGSPVNTDDQVLALDGNTLSIEDGGVGIDLDDTFATDTELTAVSNTLSSAIADASVNDPSNVASTDNVQFYYDFSESLEVNNERNGGVLSGIDNLTLSTNDTLGVGYAYVAAEEDKLRRTITSTDTFTFFWSGIIEDTSSEHTLLDNRPGGRQIRLYKTSTDRLEVYISDPTTFIFQQTGPVLEMNTPYFITLRVRPNGANTDFALTVNGVEYTSLDNANAFDTLGGTLHMNELQTGVWAGDGFISEVGLVNEWYSLSEITRLETLYRAEENPYDPATVVNTDNQLLALDGTTLSIDGGNSVDLASIDTTIADTDDQTLSLSGTTLTLEDGGTPIDLGTTFATDTEVTNAINNADYGDFFADGSVAMTGDLDMDDNSITNVHCIFLIDPSTGDEMKLEFVGGELIAGGTPVVMATAKMQQTTPLAFAELDVSMDGSVDITTLVSGGDGTGAFEYSVISNAVLTGNTLSWLTADVPFAIQARRGDDADYYTGAWFSREYSLTVPLSPLTLPLGTTATDVTSPNPTAQGDFGRDIVGYQDSFVVGAEGENRAYVYEKDGGSWALAQTLTPPSGYPAVNYGRSVEITSDWLFVGDENEESVHIYESSGGSWSYLQTLDGKANFGAINGASFGRKIDCSGNTLAVAEYQRDVGANNDAGAVHIFTYDGTTWSKQHQFDNPSTADQYMGGDIALDGDLLVVGAKQNTVSGRNNAGQAYVLRRTGTTWALEQTLQEASPVASQFFGSGVAVDEANERIIVGGHGASGNPRSTLYYYTLSGGTWQFEQEFQGSGSTSKRLGNEEVYLRGDHLVAIDTLQTDYFVFERDTATDSWSEAQRYEESDADGYESGFGVAGNTLIIGQYRADPAGINNSGKIYIYE